MLLTAVIFITSLFVLLASAKFFTEAAERIGISLNLSPFTVGVVIVALGTSLPELISAIIASSQGSSQIVAGNILGANISNIFLVLGITTIAAKRSIQLGEEYIFIDLHFMLGSALMISFFLWDGMITSAEGIILILGFAVYQVYLIRSEKPEAMPSLNQDEVITKIKPGFAWKDYTIILLAAVGVYYGASYTVNSIVDAAQHLKVDESFISISALALGTTLPEMIVSITAAKSGNPQIAIGNILGSCIFNSFMVGGIASQIAPVTMGDDLRILATTFLVGAAGFFYLLAQDKKISKWEGMLFVLFYLVFILKISGKI